MRRTMLLGVLLAMGVVGIVAGQAPQQPNVAEIEKVRDNLFMIKGGGGNTAAFITARRGVILVDTKDPGWGPAIMDKVRSITDQPVWFIINTHTHADHVGSNDFFPASVEIVAHENAKASMLKMKNFEGEKAQFLPKHTYTSKMTILLPSDPDHVELYYSALVIPTATPSSFFLRFVSPTPAISSRGLRRLVSTSAMAAAASPIPRRCECSQRPLRVSTQ